MRNPWRNYCGSVLLLIIVSLYALLIFPSTSRGIKDLFNCKNHDDLQVQKIDNGEKGSRGGEDEQDIVRRILRGIGSSPPRCASKCGKCRPCKPVHVPVPPGNPVTAEYYPEAWKCKCGNRLYTP